MHPSPMLQMYNKIHDMAESKTNSYKNSGRGKWTRVSPAYEKKLEINRMRKKSHLEKLVVVSVAVETVSSLSVLESME